MEPVKILITSDLHLGMERVNPLISREERFKVLENIISLSKDHDILLMAGDIINFSFIDDNYFDDINREFSRAADYETEIYLTPGSGETEVNEALSKNITELKTKYTFYDAKKETVIKSEKGEIFIYGLHNVDSEPLPAIRRIEKKGFHIGLFHADFTPHGSENNIKGCIGKKEIKNMELDFFALGKFHNFRLFRFSERILGAYPGSPVPCSIDETGERYVISLEIEDNRIVSFRRITVNCATVSNQEIDCSDIKSERELINTIKGAGARESMNRIELHGKRDFSIGSALNKEVTGHFRGLKIIDMTKPSSEVFIDEASAGNNLKSLFFRNLSLMLDKNPEINLDYDLMINLFSVYDPDKGGILFCDS